MFDGLLDGSCNRFWLLLKCFDLRSFPDDPPLVVTASKPACLAKGIARAKMDNQRNWQERYQKLFFRSR
ncbi:hypothetical protein ACGYLM_07385 [Sulfitobacter sp. 1A10445]|uniref:hypothetical protein n=1 Tax=unclassified Sulfitobacter TaxID=196795 RepID=UPI00374748A4